MGKQLLLSESEVIAGRNIQFQLEKFGFAIS